MKAYLIQNDDGNYLNPSYISYIQVIRFFSLGSLFAFEMIKKAKTYADVGSTKRMDSPDIDQWVGKFHEIFPHFTEVEPNTSLDERAF